MTNNFNNMFAEMKAAKQEYATAMSKYYDLKNAFEAQKEEAWANMIAEMRKTGCWYSIHELVTMTGIPQRNLSSMLYYRLETVEEKGSRCWRNQMYGGTYEATRVFESRWPGERFTMKVREGQTVKTFVNAENPNEVMKVTDRTLEYCIPKSEESKKVVSEATSTIIRNIMKEFGQD